MPRPGSGDGQGVFDQLADIAVDLFEEEAVGLNLRQVEQVADQVEQSVGGDIGLMGQFAVVEIEMGQGQQFQITDHRIERRAHLMAHIGEEGAFGQIGLFGPERHRPHQVGPQADAGEPAIPGDDEAGSQRQLMFGGGQQADLLDRSFPIDGQRCFLHEDGDRLPLIDFAVEALQIAGQKRRPVDQAEAAGGLGDDDGRQLRLDPEQFGDGAAFGFRRQQRHRAQQMADHPDFPQPGRPRPEISLRHPSPPSPPPPLFP